MIKKIELTDAIKDNIISSNRILCENILRINRRLRSTNRVGCS